MSRYLITLKALHRKIFDKLDENSFDLILRGSFISKLNAMPQDTRSMYFNRMISKMQENEAHFDYFTGAQQSQYHQPIDLTNLDTISNFNQQQGETVLNAIFNYTDTDNSALVQDVELFQMLQAFTFQETIDIAKGLGIDDIPIENHNITNVIKTSQQIRQQQQKKETKQQESNALKKQKIEKMNNKEEYKRFMETMKEKAEMPKYKPLTLSPKYKPVSLNTINRDIEVLEQRKAERECKEYKSSYSFFNNQASEQRAKTSLCLGLFALLIATKLMYDTRSNVKIQHRSPVIIKNKHVDNTKSQPISSQRKNINERKQEKEVDKSTQKTFINDTEIVFPTDLRFGGNLLGSMKEHYTVAQYTIVKND